MTMPRYRAITLHQPFATMIAIGLKRIETRSWPLPPAAIGRRLMIHAGLATPQGSDHWTIKPNMLGELVCHLHEPWTEEEQVAAGLPADGDLHGFPMPLGAIVAAVTPTACVPMVEVGQRAPETFKVGDTMLSVDNGTDRAGFLPGASRRDLHLLHRVGDVDPTWTDVSDQRPFGDFAQGRWATLLGIIEPTWEACPVCRGGGQECLDETDASAGWVECPTCHGKGTCDPVPVKGHQRVWWWTP